MHDKITIERETLQAALEALEHHMRYVYDTKCATAKITTPAIAALRAALAAQPADAGNPVSAQPAPAAVPLTDERIDSIYDSVFGEAPRPNYYDSGRKFARAVLAAAGDKP